MARGKTLRRVRKPQKKIYKGGEKQQQQQPLDYKDIQDMYADNLEKKKVLYESIKKEGSQHYDIQTSNKTDLVLEQVRTVISFLNDFHTSKLTDFELESNEITTHLEKYGLQYTSYFIPVLKTYQTYINDIEELVLTSKKIQLEFINKKVHLHLIQKRLDLLESLKLNTNTINKNIETLKESIQSIVKILESQSTKVSDEMKARTQEIESKKLELVNTIDTVKRDFPEGFISKNQSFIQGCPLGTVLENKECNYYNDSTLIESVPLQEKLLNTDSSEYVIWFNNITPSNVNDPVIFKRKLLQYLMLLSNEDSKYFNTKYVVCEQNGTPYKDSNGFYRFVPSISETPINIPGFQKYYIDYDGFPQAVQIVDVVSPKLRTDLTFERYFCALNDIDQIISGIQYIETDKEGNYNSIIPFYPVYYNYTPKENNFTKVSSNDIDSITYYFIKKYTVQIDNLVIKTIFNTSSLDPYSYNLISNLYKNKFIDISINTYYNPFVFTQFFIDENDYFLVQNSGTLPIVFNLSLNEDEKRMVLYPKQLCCFVRSSTKDTLQYGYLVLDQYIAFQTTSSKVAKYKDTYVFIENNIPLYDSEHNLISVPNFNETTNTYYIYDDMFETSPKQISEIVNVQVPENDISYEFYSYVSPYVTLCITGNIFVFCDSLGRPLLDVLGYFIPVPSPLHYDNNNYAWYVLENKKQVTLLSDYINVVSFDENYDCSIQFKSKYFTNVNNFKVFINSAGLPLIANKTAYLAVPEELNITVPEELNITEKQIQVFLPEQFKIIRMNTELSKKEIQSKMLIGLLKIYTQNTQLLENNYKDISGNINNFKDLKAQLFNILNDIEVNNNFDKLDSYTLEAKDIYKNISETNTKLEKYVVQQKQTNVLTSEIDKVRASRLAELTLSRSKLDKIRSIQNELNEKYNILINKITNSPNIVPNEKEALLVKLAKVPLDINILQSTYDGLETSYNYISNVVESSKEVYELMIQEQTLNILLKGIVALERNQNSELEVLVNLKNTVETSELNLRNVEKNKLVDLIKAEQFNLDIYKKQETKDTDVQNSINKIETIIKLVESEQKSLVVPTVEILDKQIEVYKNYLEKTIPEEKAIIISKLDSISKENDSATSTGLITQRNSLLNRIHLFNNTSEKINELINTLGNKISEEKKHTVEEELLENYNIVEEIEQNINTNTDIESSLKRIDEIDALNKKIQYDLQVIELNTPAPSPSPLEADTDLTFVETSAVPYPESEEQVSQPQPQPQAQPQQQGGKHKSRKRNQKKSRNTRKSFVGK